MKPSDPLDEPKAHTVHLLPGRKVSALAPSPGEERIVFTEDVSTALWSASACSADPPTEPVSAFSARPLLGRNWDPQRPLVWLGLRDNALWLSAVTHVPPDVFVTCTPLPEWSFASPAMACADDAHLLVLVQGASLLRIFECDSTGAYDRPLESNPLVHMGSLPSKAGLISAHVGYDKTHNLWWFDAVSPTYPLITMRRGTPSGYYGAVSFKDSVSLPWVKEPLRMVASNFVIAAVGTHTVRVYRSVAEPARYSTYSYVDVGGVSEMPNVNSQPAFAFLVACPSEGVVRRVTETSEEIWSGRLGHKALVDGGPNESRWLGPMAVATSNLGSRATYGLRPQCMARATYGLRPQGMARATSAAPQCNARAIVLDAERVSSASYTHRAVLREVDLETREVRTVWGDLKAPGQFLALHDPLANPIRMAVRGHRVILHLPAPDKSRLVAVDLDRAQVSYDWLGGLQPGPLADFALLGPFVYLVPRQGSPLVARPWRELRLDGVPSSLDALQGLVLAGFAQREVVLYATHSAAPRRYVAVHGAVVMLWEPNPRRVDLAYVDPNGVIRFATVSAEASSLAPENLAALPGPHAPIETGDPATTLKRDGRRLLAFSPSKRTLRGIEYPEVAGGHVWKVTGVGPTVQAAWEPASWSDGGGVDIVFAMADGVTVERSVDQRSEASSD